MFSFPHKALKVEECIKYVKKYGSLKRVTILKKVDDKK